MLEYSVNVGQTQLDTLYGVPKRRSKEYQYNNLHAIELLGPIEGKFPSSFEDDS